MRDHRIGLDLFTDVLDVLHRHGFARGDDEHAGRAISPHQRPGPHLRRHPGPPVRALHQPGAIPADGTRAARPRTAVDAVIVPASELKTVLAALDIAADYKRDRAEMCADCPDQSCPACQPRLHDARAYDQMAVQLLHDEQATRDARSQPGPASSPVPAIQPHPAAEREAGQ